MTLLGHKDFIPEEGEDMRGMTWDWWSITCLLGCGFAPLHIDLTKEIAVQYPPQKVQLVIRMGGEYCSSRMPWVPGGERVLPLCRPHPQTGSTWG